MANLWNQFFYLIFLGLFLTDICENAVFSGKDVTPVLFGSHNEDIFPVSYGDFNSDKITDVFAVSRDRSDLRIYFGMEEPPLFRLGIQCELRVFWEAKGFSGKNSKVKIVGVSPADFTGDGILDVMVAYQRPPESFKEDSNKPRVVNVTEVVVLRGNLTTLECGVMVNQTHVIEMVQEPLLLDINGDMIMDLFGERYEPEQHEPSNEREATSPSPTNGSKLTAPVKQKGFWIFLESPDDSSPVTPPNFYSFNNATERNDDDNLALDCMNPHANAFVDTDGDLVPELLLVTEEKNENKSSYQIKIYRVELKEPPYLEPTFTLRYSPIDVDRDNHTNVLGQPIFIDMNQDGKLVHLLPFCAKKGCQNSGIKLISYDKPPVNLPVEFSDETGTPWHFLGKLNTSNPHQMLDSNYTDTIILRAGDFNLDGFPDLIGIVRKAKDVGTMSGLRAVLFENVPCQPVPPNMAPCDNPRTFKINFNALAQYENVILATFFDIHEDGLVDILLVRRTNNNTTPNHDTYGIFAFENSPDYDANFMKVMVLSGRPCPHCPKSEIPYGNILSGPVIKYHTTTQAGNYQTSVAAQMYRSSHMTLDIPYTIFGIGQSPNFIETLQTSFSSFSKQENMNRTHEWSQIIPNSQIIVIPYPLSQPGQWSAKLFLTPSRAVLNTFGVLVGFCGLIFLIVAGLQYKERREDRKGRLQEAHRFHMM